MDFGTYTEAQFFDDMFASNTTSLRLRWTPVIKAIGLKLE